MIYIVLPWSNRLTGKDITNRCKVENAFPKLVNMTELAHFFIHRCQFINQARNFRIIVLIQSTNTFCTFILEFPHNLLLC